MSESISPGFFGKIPSRGDFLSRRLPSSVATAWENWLQALTTGVRAAGKRGWQDAWLTAPLWHFVLGRNLAGPHGAAGVLVASADRVGRLFPFTVIGAAALESSASAADWARQAEGLAVAALDDAFDPVHLDEALNALGPPLAPQGPNRAAGVWPLVLDGDWPEPGDPLAEDEAAQPGPGPDQSEWWCRGSDRVGPVRLRCYGLPGTQTATAMVLGGAEVQPRDGYSAPYSGAK
ncbi:MAG: type VI secretion system-associated protein TagF [Acetobacteraceae bacterium]|nr:type VI secretion system-associated protein TagF [Acetobacteraceae bacterium]